MIHIIRVPIYFPERICVTIIENKREERKERNKPPLFQAIYALQACAESSHCCQLGSVLLAQPIGVAF